MLRKNGNVRELLLTARRGDLMSTRLRTSGIVLLCFATAIGSSRADAESKDMSVKIAAVYNLTGSQASLGRSSLNGSILAAEQLDARGGLLVRRVQLIAVDGRSDPARIAEETRKLVHTPGLSAMTGLSDTTMVLAAA